MSDVKEDRFYMPPMPALLAFIQQLFNNSHFIEYIRAYNKMSAMTSTGAKIDESLAEVLPRIAIEASRLQKQKKKGDNECLLQISVTPTGKGVRFFFRSGRMFQQYVVTVFCAIEQNRMDYIRKHQNDLRSDYLSCLYDAVSRGDHEGIAAGSKIMLPS
nr:DNA helicase [Tanacetum cinerariifolium]